MALAMAADVSPGPANAEPISVVVCTLNEETVIERCLASVAWADELLVVDSGSTDRTRERAERAGARWIEQPWLGFSAQKNEAARLARHDWVLSLDADEVVSPRLARSLRATAGGPLDPRDGYAVDRRGDFEGVLLPNGARRAHRRSLVRLYNRRFSAWDEGMVVHEVVRCPGRIHQLGGPLLHLNDLTLDELFSLFNRYASLEADDLHRRGVRAGALSVVVRPILRFGWHYLVRGEYRLGGRGVVHSAVKAAGELMRYAKLWEKTLSPPPLRRRASADD
jgi:glycosyltransferase involved in cell wall biosynthesis